MSNFTFKGVFLFSLHPLAHSIKTSDGIAWCCMVLPGVVWHRNCIAVAVADMIMGFLARERDQLTMCQLKGSVLGVPVFGVLGSVLGLPDARKY